MKDKDIIEKVITVLGESPKSASKTPCRKYGKSDYLRFLKQKMGEEEINGFSTHLDDCPYCAQELKLADDRRKRAEYQQYLNKTIALMDQLDIRNRIDIIFQIGKDVFDIVRATGHLLGAPQAIAVRGETPPPTVHRKCMVQEFDSPPVSIQVCLGPIEGEDSSMEISVSLFDPHGDRFISNVDLRFNAQGFEKTLATDEEGVASLTVPLPGPYSIQISQNDTLIAGIDIKELSQTD